MFKAIVQKISVIKNSKFWVVLFLAVSSLSFTTAFAVVTAARTMQQSFLSRSPGSKVEPAMLSPTRWVFQDKSQSIHAKNALLIQRTLAVQSTQIQQSQSVSIDPRTMLSGNHPQNQLLFQNIPIPHSHPQENEVSFLPSLATKPAITIRVAIVQSSIVSIGSSNQFTILDASGQVLQDFPAMQAFEAAAARDILYFDSLQSGSPVWVQPETDSSLVFVNDRWYRGIVQIIPQGNSLLVVNYVNLEQYLYSVVSSEMPSSWHPEALKAQAIAARSYALVHIDRNRNSWFDLTNTQRHQVYSGVSGETPEAYAAVLDTAELVLTGADGEIFETMYASTDAIVDRFHAGKSMSQTGAALKADEGWNFVEILAFYYPDTALAGL